MPKLGFDPHFKLASRTAGGLRIVLIGLFSDLAIAAIKFAAAYLSGSSAMSSEGVHSLIDASTELILFYGLIVSSRTATPQHQFGYGREVYFWNFVVAVLIFAVGSGVTLHGGLRQIAAARPLESEWINYIVLACSAVVETGALWWASRGVIASRGNDSVLSFLRRRRDPTALTIIVGGVASLMGLAITAMGVLVSQVTGDPRYDGFASIVISAILALAAFKLAADSKALLIGLPADPAVSDAIIADVERCKSVLRVNGMVSVHLSPEQLLVALSVWFDANMSKAEVEDAIVSIENALRTKHPSIRALFMEPQTPARFEALGDSLSSTTPSAHRRNGIDAIGTLGRGGQTNRTASCEHRIPDAEADAISRNNAVASR